MGFYGSSFIFDDRPSEEFELMLYDIASDNQGSSKFASSGSVIEETVGQNWRPYFYGVSFGGKLEFNMVFGVSQDRIDSNRFLDRYELEVVASWLTGHTKYRWLDIVQEDTGLIRYKCFIKDLTPISYGNIPWALKATVSCDGAYAYTYQQVFSYDIDGTSTIQFLNESSHNGYYFPNIEWHTSGGGNFSIANVSDLNRQFLITDIPASVKHLYVNNNSCVITNDQSLNLYDRCNLKFLRLVRGYNTLNVTGNGTLKIVCEFPINAGG